MLLLSNSRRVSLLHSRYISSYLKWPLNAPNELSANLKNLENHWKTVSETRIKPTNSFAPTKYVLSMFPYPSGALHMGHMRVYTISDVLARYYSLKGYSIIHPMGWDAFGLPAENAAIERGVDPSKWTYDNIDFMRKQLQKTGIIFDWDREIFTCDPSFYKWTQWIFLKLSEKGLVKRAVSEVNWDPIDKTVLAAEQIDSEGRSWRSGAIAEKKKLRQWIVETTKYAKRLKDGLELLREDWKDVADIQSNWIGICDVYKFNLPLRDQNDVVLDETLDLRIKNPYDIEKGQFVVIGKNHQLVKDYGKETNDKYYILDGVKTMNVITGQELRIIVENIDGEDTSSKEMFLNARLGGEMLSKEDKEISQILNLPLPPVRVRNLPLVDIQEIAAFGGYGGYLTSRKLQDWVVSRQRKWGTPIPMFLSKENDKDIKRVPYESLPVTGADRGIEETIDGRRWVFENDTLDTFFDSSWYYLRFLDTKNNYFPVAYDKTVKSMPVDVYVGGIEHAAVHMFFARFISYFLKDIGVISCEEPFRNLVPQGIVRGRTFINPKNGEYVRKENVITKDGKFYDKLSNTELENVFEKMSKSKHNGTDPIEVVDNYGIDLARLQILVAAAPKSPINWDVEDAKGIKRWLDRIGSLVNSYIDARKNGTLFDIEKIDKKKEKELKEVYNYHIRNITISLEDLHLLNTAVAKIIGLINILKKVDPKYIEYSPEFERCLHSIVIMLQVFAPHTSQELWSALSQVPALNQNKWDKSKDVRGQRWPEIDNDTVIDVFINACDINCGKVFVPRLEIEKLTDGDVYERTKSQWHAELFSEFEKNGHKIKSFHLKRRDGRFYIINLDFEANTTERDVRVILNDIVKKRNAAAKEAKSKNKKK
uniref:leucine--tRNA ligase n=1 Tax=Strongyloides venezuelensis TaxID=75913 RepID=A0A0K0G4C9_STRVS